MERRNCLHFVLIISGLCTALYFPLLWRIRPTVDSPVSVNLIDIIRPYTRTTKLYPALNICSKNKSNNATDIFLLVVVFSACHYFEQRQAIRDTWGSAEVIDSKPMPFPSSEPNESGIKLNINTKVRVVFMLGYVTNETVQSLVKAESERYDDIVQEDFLDTYQNLTIKTIMMLKWILSQKCHSQVDYVLKTDDDTFVNVPQLLKYLTNNHETLKKRSALIGVRICRARVVRNIYDKWYVHPDLISDRYYPDYLSGSGYVIPTNAIPRLYAATRIVQFLFIEDVYLTSICARYSDLELIEHEGFTIVKMPLDDPCVFHYIVTAHHITSDQMRTITKKMKQDWNLLKCGQEQFDKRNRQISYCSHR